MNVRRSATNKKSDEGIFDKCIGTVTGTVESAVGSWCCQAACNVQHGLIRKDTGKFVVHAALVQAMVFGLDLEKMKLGLCGFCKQQQKSTVSWESI